MSCLSIRWFLLIFLLSLVFGLSQNSSAQMINDANQIGLPPLGTFGGSNFDLVSYQNGNLHVTIPLQSLPQRGVKSYDVAFVFDLPTWTLTGDFSGGSGPVWDVEHASDERWGSNTHFRLVTPFYYTVGHQDDTITCTGGSQGVKDQFVVYDPTGAKHPFYLEYAPAPTTCGAANITKGIALDGSGIQMDVSQYPTIYVTLKDGTKVIGLSGNQEDRNGNLMSASSDTLQRNPIVVANVGTKTYTTPLGKQVSGPQYTTWTYTDSNGAGQSYTLNYTAIDLSTNFCQFQTPPLITGDCTEYSGTYLAPSSLSLPSGGGTYGFSWFNKDAGELKEITLPTGGNISYTYIAASMLVQKANQTQCTNTGTQCISTLLVRNIVASRSVQDGTSTNRWAYSLGLGGGSVTDPLGNKETHVYTLLGSNLSLGNHYTVETQVVYANSSGTTVRTENKDYSYEQISTGMSCIPLEPYQVINARPIRVTTILPNGLQKKVETDYETLSSNLFFTSNCPYTNTYLNPSAFREYDWGSGAPGSLLRQTAYAYLHTNNSNYLSRNIADRVLTKKVSDGGGNQAALTTNEYDNYSHPNQSMQASGAVQHDSVYSTSFVYRGNLTAVSKWLNPGNTSLTSTYQYDDAGNILSEIDPAGNKTTYAYTDSWSGAACNPSGAGKAYATIITNPLGQQTTNQYFACTGLRASMTDPNLQMTSYSYDFADRRTVTNFPDGGQISVSYNDSPPVSFTTTTMVTSTLNRTSTVLKDGLGRVSQTQLTSDPSGTDYVDTTYDSLGRLSTKSNPYRSTGDTTYGLTTTQYDPLSREIKQIPADGSSSSNNMVTVYDIALNTTPPRNCTQVTDEAGKSRKSCMDGLGRMVQVFEDPNGLNYETDFTYNALDDVLTVTQKGGTTDSTKWRTRTFSYDSLSRLLSAANPESGTVQYGYDADSNVIARTAPLPNQTGSSMVTTTYTYDALNRLTSKSYKDGGVADPYTANVLYGYDAVPLTGCTTAPPGDADSYPTGRRTSMCDGSGATNWTHDKMGRILQERRTIGGVQGRFSNDSYTLDGSVSSVTVPVGYQITYTYNGASQPTLVKVYGTSAYTYASNITYAPSGALVSASMGPTPITLTNAYNARQQPILLSAATTSATIFSDCYDFHSGLAIRAPSPCSFPAYTSGNNGNLLTIVNNRDNTRTQSFSYDGLNRIASGQSNGSQWGETFTIDGWGNLTNEAGISGKTNHEGLNTSALTNNRLTGFGYDAAGNMTSNTPFTYIYDAENRLIAAGGMSYIYDGDGNRVEKCTEGAKAGTCASGATGMLYWWGTGNAPQAETDLSGNVLEDYIFLNGQRIARRDAATNVVHFYFSDHLGSHAVVENDSGTSCEQDVDYYPYGGVEHDYCTTPVAQNYKFTGKERDAESGLDNFGARYDSSSLGRFQTPDPLGGKLINPQTLNKYAYVANNPINFTDPTGLYMCADDAKDAKVHCTSDKDVAFETQRKEALQSKNADVVRGASAYGDPGKDNGVTVKFGDPGAGNNGVTTHDLEADSTAANGLRAKETVTIRDTLTGTDLKDAISHEGSHVADAQAFVPTIKPDTADFAKNLTKYQTELRAYMVTQSVLSSANEKHTYDCGLMGTCQLGTGVTDVTGNINRLLDYQYHVTPQNQGQRLYPGFVPPPPATTVPH